MTKLNPKKGINKEKFILNLEDVEIEEPPETKEKQVPKRPEPNIDPLHKPKLLPSIFNFLKKKKKSGRN